MKKIFSFSFLYAIILSTKKYIKKEVKYMSEYLKGDNISKQLNILYMSEAKYNKDIYKTPYRNFSIETVNLPTFDSRLAQIYLLKENNKKIFEKKCDIFVLDSSYGINDKNMDMVKQIIKKNEALHNNPVCGVYVYNFFINNDYVQIANLYYVKNGNLIEKEDITLPKDSHGIKLLNISLLEIESLKANQKIKKIGL